MQEGWTATPQPGGAALQIGNHVFKLVPPTPDGPEWVETWARRLETLVRVSATFADRIEAIRSGWGDPEAATAQNVLALTEQSEIAVMDLMLWLRHDITRCVSDGKSEAFSAWMGQLLPSKCVELARSIVSAWRLGLRMKPEPIVEPKLEPKVQERMDTVLPIVIFKPPPPESAKTEASS